MEISVFDENAAPFDVDIKLDADEVDSFASSAYKRLARIFKCDESDVREKARHYLTAHEIQTFLKETTMAKAADLMLSDSGPLFVGNPKNKALSEYREHEPFEFHVTVHPLPAMNLDIETPISRRRKKKAGNTGADEIRNTARENNSQSDEEFVAETLRARLNGTIPDALIREAFARRKEEFLSEIGAAGLTYREYRIAHRVKPQDVEAVLYDEAFEELSRAIALDTVFVAKSLEITPEDEQAMLSELASGRESSLRDEFASTGRLWMLVQKTRRAVALRWAVEHLLEK